MPTHNFLFGEVGTCNSYPFLCSSRFEGKLSKALEGLDKPYLRPSERSVLSVAWTFILAHTVGIKHRVDLDGYLRSSIFIPVSMRDIIKTTISSEFEKLKDELKALTVWAKTKFPPEQFLFADFCLPDVEPELFKLLDSNAMNSYCTHTGRSKLYVFGPIDEDVFFKNIEQSLLSGKFETLKSAEGSDELMQQIKTLISFEKGCSFALEHD